MHWTTSVHRGPMCLMNKFIIECRTLLSDIADATSCLVTLCKPVLAQTTTEHQGLAGHDYQETEKLTQPPLPDIHRESKKTRHQTLGHNFTNYYPIFFFFTSQLSRKFATNSCLNIPPRFKHVATLPCEIWMQKNGIILFLYGRSPDIYFKTVFG